MPFRKAKGRLWGPGVLDMKAGIAFFLFAMQALRELDIPVEQEVLSSRRGEGQQSADHTASEPQLENLDIPAFLRRP